MTGRQLYNYLLTSARDGLEMYASGFGSSSSAVVVAAELRGDRVILMCKDVATGEQSAAPLKAGRLLRQLHEASDRDVMDREVVLSRKYSSWGTDRRELQSVSEAPCYKGRALLLCTRPPR